MFFLKEFTFRNCYSFKDEALLSMTANYNMKDNINFVIKHGDGDNAVYLNPVAAIYGSNAGGKTNILRALSDAIRNISEVKRICNEPFMYPFHEDETFSHRLVIVHDDIEYEYEYTANAVSNTSWEDSKVLKESLRKRDLRAKGDAKAVFVREGTAIKESMYNDKDQQNEHLKMIAANNSILVMRHVGELGWDFFKPLYQWCSNVVMDMRTPNEKDRHEDLIKYASTLHSDEESLLRFSNFITDIDPALFAITTMTQQNDNVEPKIGEKARFLVWHKYREASGDVDKLPFLTQRESNGMVKLMEIYPIIKRALDEGKPFICDELDKFLHPLIFKRVVEMFNDTGEGGVNKKGAQLIFAAHNTIVVNREDLRRDEICFVDKNEYGESVVKRLSEITDEKGSKIRLDARYDVLYLSGNFGAIPEKFRSAVV
ncbi:MAG: ATP-binding protein [Treponema sp.]|jgi:AAA15 family ATPase/GTPase|nr:ATP-binding protein [Treponema sp.]